MGKNHPQWDALTQDQLRARGSFKWSLFPDTLGAFIAEMDFGTSPAVAAAIRKAADEGVIGYLPKPLEAAMGAALAGYLARRYGWQITPGWIKALPDVLRGYELAFTYYLRPDQPIVVPTPAYTPFLAIPLLHGRKVIEVPMLFDADGLSHLDEAGIEAALAPNGGLLVLCSPHNPLGRVYDADELHRIAQIAIRTGARVFADEIHAPLTFAGHDHIPYASLSAEAAGHSITATSASKGWNIPGLTCAQVTFSNQADADLFQSLGHFITRGASNVGVLAAIAAYSDLADGWMADVITYLDRNRRHLAARLAQELPQIQHVMPQATYLAWLDCSALDRAPDLARRIRDATGLALTDGADCGQAGAYCLRLNFATPRPILDAAIDRLAAFFTAAKA